MILINIDNLGTGSVQIGRQGEYDFQEIHFTMATWVAQHPTGMVTVVYERPDGETYPVVAAATPDNVVWLPNLADLSVAGAGRLEARLTTETGLGKSATIPVTVAPSISAIGAVPTPPIPDWTYTVADNAIRAEKAADAAEESTKKNPYVNDAGTWMVWNGAEYVDTGISATGPQGEKGDTGDPGYTPQKGIDYTDGYTPQKGIDYTDGNDGEDGVSCTHSWNGTTLTITSASGTSSADLKGDPGHTPQKGTDYYTAADKVEMVNSVLDALPTWTGGSY